MTSPHDRFRINAPDVVSDNIEGETIGINLQTGNYYSLPGVASHVWSMIGQRFSAGAIVERLGAAYSGDDAADVERAVYGFLRDLLAEGLVVPDDGPAPAPCAMPEVVSPTGRFEPLRFERYTDMREFLLVDPIHDVDVTQWPEPGARQTKS